MNYFVSITDLSARIAGCLNRPAMHAAFVFCFLLGGLYTANAQYCTASATYTADEDIFGVVLKGNTVTLNNQPGCRNALYTDFTAGKPVPDLIAGSRYSMDVMIGGCGTISYTNGMNVWIDYNGDFTFQTSEALTDGSFTQGCIPTVTRTLSFAVPCKVKAGTTRMRVMVIEGSTSTNNPCYTGGYGEIQDYTVSLSLPVSISVDFIAPSTVFVKNAVKFINVNKDNVGNDWDADLNGYNYVSPPNVNPDYPDFRYAWTSTGSKCVKLRAYNCAGIDSVTKCLNVIAPTKVPVADFVASSTLVEEYETVQLSDVSSDGPYEWTWNAYDSSDAFEIKDVASGDVEFSDETAQNPEVTFFKSGCYTVELVARNDLGLSQLKKKICYIRVTAPRANNLCFGPNFTENQIGTVFDDGGEFGDYADGTSRGCARLRITPCNAKKINMTFTQLKFAKPDHVVRVFDGRNAGGKLLRTINNNDRASLPFTVTATSGSMYIDFDATSGGSDSGFVAHYSSELGPPVPPVPSFTTSSTPGYNRAPLRHINTTKDIIGVPEFTWTIDGTPVGTSDTIVLPDGRVDMVQSYYTDGPYEVCLEIKSCTGSAKSCQTINIITPNTPTAIDYTASNRRPALGEIVQFTSMTDKADKFMWQVSPSVAPLSPTTLRDPNPKFKFTAPGKYTFTLYAWNSNDSVNTVAKLTKNNYIVVVNFCKPVAGILSSDVAVTNVKLTDAASNTLLDNATEGGLADYTDYTASQRASLTFGATYQLELSRFTTIDPANRKAWIDFNGDGDFNDAGEEILTEAASNNAQVTSLFTVPSMANSFEGATRMRVAINYASNATGPCGPAVAGEYEDYSIVLVNDNAKPVITLNGPDTVEIEQCYPYVDALATAYDASEGNITSRIVVTTDLEDSCRLGIYTTEFNVQDASGNKAGTVKRTIIVVKDRTKPKLFVAGANPLVIEGRRDNAPYTDPGVTASDNVDGNLSAYIQVQGTVNTRQLGVYPLTYIVRDKQGNADTATRSVIVVDTKAPDVVLNGPQKIQVGGWWGELTTASDALDNNPVIKVSGTVNPLERGLYPVTYTAVDASGNMSDPVVRTYEVDDYIAPVISFGNNSLSQVYYHDVNTPYVSEEPSVSDNYYADSMVSLVPVNPKQVDWHKLGVYTERWRAQDPSGNISYADRTIHVVDREAPVVYAPTIHACVESPINPYEDVRISDNYYSPASLMPEVEIVFSNVNQWQQGEYEIIYRVTDPSGNKSELYKRSVVYTAWPNCMNSLSLADVAAEDKVTVYPNPNNGEFVVSVANGGKTSVAVYNLLGELVNTQASATGTFEMNLKGFASGVYLLKIQSGQTLITKKVTIN